MKFEHLITIRSDRKRKKGRRWPVEPSEKSKLLIRRKLQGIKFWDFGYMLDATLPFESPYKDDPIPNHPNVGSDPVDLAGNEPITLAHYEPIHDEIFAQSTDTWTDTFRHITDDYENVLPIRTVTYKGTNYVLAASAVWDGERLVPNGAETDDSFSVNLGPQLFTAFSINSGPYTATKVTATADYAADSVAFAPSKNMDVFLVPNMIVTEFLTNHTTILPIGDFSMDALDWLRVIYPRETFLDPANDIYGQYLDAFSWQPSDPLSQYEDVYAVTEYWRDNYGHRALRAQSITLSPDIFTDIDPADYGPPAAFPAPPTLPTSGIGNFMTANFTPENSVQGALLAVIKKGGVYYYVWHD